MYPLGNICILNARLGGEIDQRNVIMHKAYYSNSATGGGGGGGGLLRSIFAWYVLLTSQKPYSIIVYSVANYIDPILVTFGQMVNV